ncbi:hypothetical protein EZ428_13120 [Pedobacter frigiditerrae]|uniref:Uncharacterized protein n=1 Tax=Pedobacter frigiditerrae TaxID=2530452 RepID=A0A4V2MIF5_9SPHI|nr:hypothetical protein [Pedobacter frigiditerrae]TCC90216.1 hypothetical protein EZ428_13120 [Pedobacter frigiditerrae]
MKTLTSIIIFLFVTTTSFGQDISGTPYGLTAEDNEIWLKKVLLSDKETKLTLIQHRFFRQKEFKKLANDAIPILIANGIVVNEVANIELRNLLVNQLTPDNVQVTILDKEPEGLYVNKAWTGIIILNIKDRKINKLLKRQKSL